MGIEESVGKIVSGMLTGGAGAIPGIIDKSLALVLKLTEDDPVKRVRALREFQNSLEEIIKEAEGAKDLTDLTLVFIKLMDSK